MVNPSSPRRAPDTYFVLAMLAIVSVAQLVSDRPPGALETAVGQSAARVWLAMLGLSAVITLAGVLWRSRIPGLALEFVGRIVLTFACAAFTQVALFTVEPPASLTAALLLALAGSSG